MILPEDTTLYHWSPAARRKGIARSGLIPGKLSVDRLWRPPYVAFALNPRAAWQMSGEIHPEIPSWDLWVVYITSIDHGLETIPWDDGSTREVRVYTKTPASELFYVGSREQKLDERGRP